VNSERVSFGESVPFPDIEWAALEGAVVAFGGTFDPVQSAHIEIARRALSSSAFATTGAALKTQVVFIPARLNPLKSDSPHASDKDRLQMIQSAIRSDARFLVSPIELNRASKGPSFTVDTITQVRELLPEATKLFLLMGGDSVLSLPLWQRPAAILDLVDGVMVAPRTNEDSRLLEKVGARFSPEQAAKLLGQILPGSPIDVSASVVRERLARNQSVVGLVPAEVEVFIRERSLYQSAILRTD